MNKYLKEKGNNGKDNSLTKVKDGKTVQFGIENFYLDTLLSSNGGAG
ncbi:hypothetical protein [Neobacillus niacini]|nr:hypothetical protein [Neobacillus niacini]MDR7000767.1 hypothetical protein [Neobacillus niacini]